MKKFSMLAPPSCFVLLVGLSSLAGDAVAQQKTLEEQLVGSWTFVSSENIAPDSTRRQLFGPSPKGILILDASGRFAQMLVNPNRPKFKAIRRDCRSLGAAS